MDENDRIVKKIIKHIYTEKRATKNILLTAVRRQGASRTTMQQLNQRVEYLVNEGVLQHARNYRRHEVYILSEEKRIELDDRE